MDDEPDALALMRLFLSSEGFCVVSASSAQAALQRMRERLPDLIITDRTMPGMSGIELCTVLRANRATRHIPIILHTAAEPDWEEEPPYDRLFVKPADFEALARAVRALLAKARAHGEQRFERHDARNTDTYRGINREQGGLSS